MSNLRLPQTLPIGAGQEKTKKVLQDWDTIDQVQEEMHLKGLIAKDAPVYACPELTQEMLTTTNSASYTETYAHLLAWFGYASDIYALVQATVLQYKNMLDVLAAEGRRIARETNEKKLSVSELEDRLLLNPEYQEVMHKLQRFQQAELMYKAKVESIERSLRVVSRQVEIRRLDLEQNRTGANMPGRNFTGGGRFGQ